MKTLKKCIAILSAVTMLATSAPMVFAAKTSPAEGVTNTQIGYNNYDSMTESTNPDQYNGTPWINKLSTGTVTATGDTAHPVAVKLNVNDNGASHNWYNTFNDYYTDAHEEPEVYSASAMIKMPAGNKAGYEFVLSGIGYRFFVQKDGRLTNGTDGADVVNNITLTPNTWHKLSIVCDRPNTTVKVYIDGKQAFNYKSSDVLSENYFMKLVQIVNYKLLNDTGASSAESGLYMDDLSLDKVVDGAFYGSAVVNDNNITVTLSEVPGALATNAISVKKADGTAVTTGTITVSGKTITIPITREMATEYVVCLPADLTSTSGNKIYSPEIFVNSGIKSTDKIVVIDENFEGGTYKWGYTNGAYITDGVLPTYFKGTEAEGKPKRFLYARTAYKNDTDGTVADVAPADWANVSKVLAVQQTGTTDTGVWIEFPRTIVDDWTMEFDFMMNGIGNAENKVADKDAVGWALYPIAGDKNINVANSTVTYSGETTGKQNLMPIFGMTAGKMLGEPNWTSKDGDLYWNSSQSQDSTSVPGTKRQPMDINKWYHVKLDFNAGSYTATKCEATVTTSDGTSFLNREWNLPIGMNHLGEWGYQFNGVMFKMPDYAGMNTMYLDNVKVTTQNLTDHKVKTVTLTDMENEEFGAVSQASDMVTKAKIDFTTGKGTNVIDPTTVNTDTIKVTDSDGNPVEFTLGGYNALTTSVELKFNKMLTVGERYTLTVKGVKAQEYAAPYGKGKNMFELLPYTAQINVVDKGEYKVVAFKIVDAEGNPVETLTTGEVNIKATIKNTSGKDESFDMILASYDKTTKEFNNVSRETKTAENGTYTTYTLETKLSVDAATDEVKGFLWEGMNSLRPLTTGISK